MLRQRVITASVLLAVVLLTLYVAPSWAWGLLSAAALWFAGREWAQLISPAAPAGAPTSAPASAPATASFPWLATGLVIGALACLLWRETTGRNADPGWASGLLLLDLLLWLLLAVPAVFRARLIPFGAQLFAAISLFCLWLGLYELRRIDPTLLLSTMAVIWIADAGAYFVGRAWGRRKLAPRVSPGKSWEGAIGGLVLVLLVAIVGLVFLPEQGPLAAMLPRWLAERAGVAATLLLLLVMVALSVIGDLYESLLKRARGVKDSGQLFPGHGGMLDRIDALVPTMPLALFVFQALQRAS